MITIRYWKSPFAYVQINVPDCSTKEEGLRFAWACAFAHGYRPPMLWEWWRWFEDRPPAGFIHNRAKETSRSVIKGEKSDNVVELFPIGNKKAG